MTMTTFRSLTVIAAAVLLSTVAVKAQVNVRPDFPGAKQMERGAGPDIGANPRPDFPGAKQTDPSARPETGTSPRSDIPGPKQGDSAK
jgi:hypothetical protein